MAGFTVKAGVIVACAPIIDRSLHGRKLEYAQALCLERGWELAQIEVDDASA